MKFRRPEEELVILCAQTHLSDSAKARIEVLLEQPIDWAYCHEFAQYHHSTPLLFNTLYHHWKHTPPTAFMDQMRAWYQQHSFRNLLVTAELLKFQQRCIENNIVMLAVKGPVLAKQIYGDVRLREFADLDVVVHMDDVNRTKELVLNNGYELIEPASLEYDSTYVRSHYNYAFVHRTRMFNLELHWRLWQSEFGAWLKLENVWDNLGEVAFTEKEAIHTLVGVDLLLYLCAHGSKHQWSRLSWICDVNELLCNRNAQIDWDEVVRQIKQARCVRVVLLGVYLAHTLFGTALSPQIQRLIEQDDQIELLAAEIHERLLRRADQEDDLRYYLRIREHWIDKVQHIMRLTGRRMIPTDRDILWIKLPRRLFFVYYVTRPIRLGIEQLTKLLKRRTA